MARGRQTTAVLGVAAAALALGATDAHAIGAAIGPATLSVPEGNSGASTATVNVTPTCNPVADLLGGSLSVDVGLTNGTATGGRDFGATPSPSTVTVTCGALGAAGPAQPISLTIIGDTLDEDDETFTVTASTSSGPVGSSVVTITDDDAPPTVQIADKAQAEGTGANPTALLLPVTLSAASGRTIQIPYTLTAGTATAGSDFTATGGTLTINPGQTTANISVPVVADNVDEDDETFTVTLGNPGSPATYTLGGKRTATATIVNDDAPGIGIASTKAKEGTGGGTVFTFNVGLSSPSRQTVTVKYATTDLPQYPAGNRATAGTDYVATSGTLTFAPGETAKTFTVAIAPDAVAEGTTQYRGEIFGVQLSDPSPNLVLLDGGGGPGLAFGFIDDDDTGTPSGGGSTGSGGGTGSGSGGGISVIPGTGSGSGSGGDTSDGTPPAIKVSKIGFKKGVASIAITCPATETTCRGTLSVFTVKVKGAKVKALRKELKLGSKVFVANGGTSIKLTLRLSKANAKALKAYGKPVTVKAFAVARDASGNVATKTVSAKIKG